MMNMQIAKRFICAAIGIAVFACMAGCAPQTEVVKLFESDERGGKQYDRVLVVSESIDEHERERFEEMLAAAIADGENEAITSHSVVGLDAATTTDVIAQAVTESGADAVLITQIASVDTTTSINEGRVNVEPTCRKGDFYDPFLYDYPEVKEPDTVSVSHTVVVIASLYDGLSNDRLWTVQSTCFDKRSSMAFMADQSATIAAQLKKDRLLN